MFEIKTWIMTDQTMTLQISGMMEEQSAQPPRLSVWFQTKTEDRILPLPITEWSDSSFTASYTYELWNLFLNDRVLTQMSVTVLNRMVPVTFASIPFSSADWVMTGDQETFHLRSSEPFVLHRTFKNWINFLNYNRKEQKKMLTGLLFRILYLPFYLFPVRRNRITFCSNRRDQLSGNPVFVYNELLKVPGLDLKILLKSSIFSFSGLFRFFYLYATSSVLLVDDHYHYLSYTPKKKKTSVVQLWHACGAFKTFGFSRLGKDTLLLQCSPNHRQYDAAIVSSQGVARCYAEGFGIPTDHVYPLGVPRTDLFFDRSIRKTVRQHFFAKYPSAQGKKILLFAPTFRGGGKGDANYPMQYFPVDQILSRIPEDTILLVKLHPYIRERMTVGKIYQDRVIDCSDQSELNDLLFVTDVLITDYSSVVYEAAILDIPMIFYAFDLEEYIATRDFYEEFVSWIPGKLVRTADELIDAVNREDYCAELLPEFKRKNLGNADGNSSVRVAKLVCSLLPGNQEEKF